MGWDINLAKPVVCNLGEWLCHLSKLLAKLLGSKLFEKAIDEVWGACRLITARVTKKKWMSLPPFCWVLLMLHILNDWFEGLPFNDHVYLSYSFLSGNQWGILDYFTEAIWWTATYIFHLIKKMGCKSSQNQN